MEKSRKSVGVEAKLIQAKCMTEPQDSKKKAKLEAAKAETGQYSMQIHDIIFGWRGTVTWEEPRRFLKVIIKNM